MFTNAVRLKLDSDYGIRMPHELLCYFVSKYCARFVESRPKIEVVAFAIANEYQRALSS